MDPSKSLPTRPSEQAYHPELIPRRGELIAWGGASLLVAAWIFIDLEGFQVGFLLPLLAIPLTLAAMGISLGNWMDRHTTLILREKEIAYRNGLRSVTLRWEEIAQVRVLPAQWGQKIQVFGKRSYFGFHTLGEVNAHGRIMARTGFAQGESILKRILEKTNLIQSQPAGSDRLSSGVYYTRE